MFGFGRAGPERSRTVADLEMVGDGGVGPVGDHLGDPDRVLGGELAQRLALADLVREFADPGQAEIPDRRVIAHEDP